MSQIAPITLATIVYDPIGTQAGTDIPAKYRSAGSAVSANRATLLQRRVKGLNKRNRVVVTLDFPISKMVDGIEELVDTAFFKGEFTLPDQMTVAQRTAFTTAVKDLFLATNVKDAIVSDSPAY